MSSDSVISFLDLARESRLFPADQVDDLLREPEASPVNLSALCDQLESRGVLTKYQAEKVRNGQGAELNFAGYPITDELGEFPEGRLFRALHPIKRTELWLRRYRSDWPQPADNLVALLTRADQVRQLNHPNLAQLIDVGVYREEPFAVLEPFESADLDLLIRDIGPMPGALAAVYASQLCQGLKAVHGYNMVHGHIHPGCVLAGPLVPMAKPREDGSTRYRPAATATLKLFDVGLIPIRPSLQSSENPTEPLTPEQKSQLFLPPERVNDAAHTKAGDIYGLGATLYYLLTGQPPVQAITQGELVEKLQQESPRPLGQLRPDLAPELVQLLEKMLSRSPEARPSLAEVEAELQPLLPAPANPQPANTPAPAAAEIDLSDLPTPGQPPYYPPIPPMPMGQPTWAPPPFQPPPHAPAPVPAPYQAYPGYAPPPGQAHYPAPAPVEHQPAPFPGQAPSYQPPPAYYPEEAALDSGTDEPARTPRATSDGNSIPLAYWLIAGALLQVLAFAGWFYLFNN